MTSGYQGACASMVEIVLRTMEDAPIDGDPPRSAVGICEFARAADERVLGQRVTIHDVRCGLLTLRQCGRVVAADATPESQRRRVPRGRDALTLYALAEHARVYAPELSP